MKYGASLSLLALMAFVACSVTEPDRSDSSILENEAVYVQDIPYGKMHNVTLDNYFALKGSIQPKNREDFLAAYIPALHTTFQQFSLQAPSCDEMAKCIDRVVAYANNYIDLFALNYWDAKGFIYNLGMPAGQADWIFGLYTEVVSSTESELVTAIPGYLLKTGMPVSGTPEHVFLDILTHSLDYWSVANKRMSIYEALGDILGGLAGIFSGGGGYGAAIGAPAASYLVGLAIEMGGGGQGDNGGDWDWDDDGGSDGGSNGGGCPGCPYCPPGGHGPCP